MIGSGLPTGRRWLKPRHRTARDPGSGLPNSGGSGLPTLDSGAVWGGKNGVWGVGEWTSYNTFGAGAPVSATWGDIERWPGRETSGLLTDEEMAEIRAITFKWRPVDFPCKRIVILPPSLYGEWVASEELQVDSQPLWDEPDVEHHVGV